MPLGDNHLPGGDDWDQRVVDWLVDKFRGTSGIDLTKDKDGGVAAGGSRREGKDR